MNGKGERMNELTGSWILSAVSYVGQAAQNEIVQYVLLGLSVLASLGSIILTIIKIVDWWKRSHADGKISSDEVDDLKDIINEFTDSIKDEKDALEKGNEDEITKS